MKPRPVVERVMARVALDETTGCWIFLGAKRNGYGVVGLGSRSLSIDYVHRVMYAAVRGPIPPGLHIDHLCRTRACCNPAHLELVTQQINNARAAFHRRFIPHCKRGHVRTPENAYWTGKQWRCRACTRLRQQQQGAKAA